MSAPKGNQFWKQRSKHGRDKLFDTPSLLWEAACEYFEWCDSNPLKEEKLFSSQGEILKGEISLMRPYTIQGLCLFLGCNAKYLNHFESNLKESDQDFSNIVTRIREVIYNQKFEGAATGLLNPNIIARDLGLVDKKDNHHSGKVNLPVISWLDDPSE